DRPHELRATSRRQLRVARVSGHGRLEAEDPVAARHREQRREGDAPHRGGSWHEPRVWDKSEQACHDARVKLDARLQLFVTLVAVFVTCLVVGDIIGGKLTSFELFGREWVFSVGQLAFPVTFILTDILNEFYG